MVSAVWRDLFHRPYRCVFPTTAHHLVRHGAVLVDVREAHEWDSGRPPHALHIPLAELPHRLDELPDDRPVIAICRSGVRSKRAARLLALAGRDASHRTGGLIAWRRAGLPIVNR